MQRRVVRVGDKMLVWGLRRYGTPKPVANAVVVFGRAVREGYFDVVDPAFERLSGRPPLSLLEVPHLPPRRSPGGRLSAAERAFTTLPSDS